MNAPTVPTNSRRQPYTHDPEALRAELAPRDAMEAFIVAQIIWAAGQISRLIQDAPDQPDRKWQQLYNIADRTFHRNLRILEKSRRQAIAAPAPIPAPRPATPTPPARRPEPIPWPKAAAPRSRRTDGPPKGTALLESSLGGFGMPGAGFAAFSVGAPA